VHGGRSAFVSSFLAVLIAGLLAAPALAQYPPPTPTATSTPTDSPIATQEPRASACAVTGVLFKKKNGTVGFRARTEFAPGSKIGVKGRKKCAGSQVRVRVSIDLDGETTKIGAGESSDKGGYLIKGKIPSSTSFGRHAIFVNAKKRSYVTDIEVVPANGARSSGFAGTAGPMLAAWVALAGIVAAFVVGTRRRRSRPLAAVAVAQSDVPLLDTWDFVPVLPKRRRGGASPAKKKRKAPAARKRAKPKASKPKASKPKASKPKAATTGKAAARRKPPASAKKRSSSKVAPKRPQGKAKPRSPKGPKPKGKER
jgi:hypothetical protein